MELAIEGKITLEDKKANINQVCITIGSLNPFITCNVAKGHEEKDMPNIFLRRMIKFGNFEPLDVNELLSHLMPSDLVLV